MNEVVLKLSAYFFTAFLAYFLKRVGLFKKSDSAVVTAMILNVVMPAMQVCSFANLERDFSLLSLVLVGFAASGLPWVIGALSTKRLHPSLRAVYLTNGPTLNVTAFALPFLKLFLPASALAGICLFDIGNVIMIYGFVHSMSSLLLRIDDGGVGFRGVMKRMFSSVPFCTYACMLLLFFLNIQLPKPVYDVLGSVSLPGGFLVMFNLGLLLEVKFSWNEIKSVLGAIFIRLINGSFFAALAYFLLPYDAGIKKGIALVVFAPCAAICPYFTKCCKGDDSLSSLMTMLNDVVSIVMIAVLGFLLA